MKLNKIKLLAGGLSAAVVVSLPIVTTVSCSIVVKSIEIKGAESLETNYGTALNETYSVNITPSNATNKDVMWSLYNKPGTPVLDSGITINESSGVLTVSDTVAISNYTLIIKATTRDENPISSEKEVFLKVNSTEPAISIEYLTTSVTSGIETDIAKVTIANRGEDVYTLVAEGEGADALNIDLVEGAGGDDYWLVSYNRIPLSKGANQIELKATSSETSLEKAISFDVNENQLTYTGDAIVTNRMEYNDNTSNPFAFSFQIKFDENVTKENVSIEKIELSGYNSNNNVYSDSFIDLAYFGNNSGETSNVTKFCYDMSTLSVNQISSDTLEFSLLQQKVSFAYFFEGGSASVPASNYSAPPYYIYSNRAGTIHSQIKVTLLNDGKEEIFECTHDIDFKDSPY